jgi:hypothetical protein
MRVPGSRFIRALRVPARVQAGDIVVTGDIPLAAQVLDKAACRSIRAATGTRSTPSPSS